MSATSGIQPIQSYTGVTTAGQGIDRLLLLVPDVDGGQGGTGVRPGGQAGQGGGHLDEMSPAAIVQLRVELLALKAVITAFNAP